MSSKITEEDRAYLAGLIDGEGCIFISTARQSGRKRHLKIYRLLVVISQANESYLRLWCDKTGLGKVYDCGPNRRHVFQWHCGSRDAEKLLRLAYPYLIVKREQADIAFEFRQTKGVENLGHHYKHSYSLLRKREELRQKLIALKKGYMVAEVEQDTDEYEPCPQQMRLL